MKIPWAHLKKSKPPRKLEEMWTFLSLAFNKAPDLHIVEKISCCKQKNSDCKYKTPPISNVGMDPLG